MANKRDLKKQIKLTCGDIVGECVFAKLYFDGVDQDKMDEIIVRTACLQTSAIDKVTVWYDKTLKSFDNNVKKYRKARNNYFKSCYNAIKTELSEAVSEIVTEMNSALSQEQKDANKAALSK